MQTHTPAPIPSAPHAPSSSPTTNEILTAFFDSSEPISQIADQLRMSVEQLAESLSSHARLIKRLTKVVELRARFKMFTAELVAVESLKTIAEFDRDPERRRKASTKVLCHVAKYRLPPRRKPNKPLKPSQAPNRVGADILRNTSGSTTPAVPAPTTCSAPSMTSASIQPPHASATPTTSESSAAASGHQHPSEIESPLQEAIRLESACVPQPASAPLHADPDPAEPAPKSLCEPAPETAPELAPEPAPEAVCESTSVDAGDMARETTLPEPAPGELAPGEPAPGERAPIESVARDASQEVPASSPDPAPTPDAPTPDAPTPIVSVPPDPCVPIWPLRPPLHTCR